MKPDPIRILLVEDSESDAFLIRTALSRLPEKCELVHVRTLGDTRKALDNESFDILLADLNLPDSAHGATVEFLLKTATKIAIIALNSCDDRALKERCEAHGIGCFSKQYLLSPAFGKALREKLANK